MLGVSDYTQTAWMNFLSELEDSVLVCDSAALELAHWSITIPKLIEQHKVVNVHHVTDNVISYRATSVVFLLGFCNNFYFLLDSTNPFSLLLLSLN